MFARTLGLYSSHLDVISFQINTTWLFLCFFSRVDFVAPIIIFKMSSVQCEQRISEYRTYLVNWLNNNLNWNKLSLNMKIVLVRLAVLTAVCPTLDYPNVAFNSVVIFASPFVYRFGYFIAQRSTVFNITTAIYIFFIEWSVNNSNTIKNGNFMSSFGSNMMIIRCKHKYSILNNY